MNDECDRQDNTCHDLVTCNGELVETRNTINRTADRGTELVLRCEPSTYHPTGQRLSHYTAKVGYKNVLSASLTKPGNGFFNVVSETVVQVKTD